MAFPKKKKGKKRSKNKKNARGAGIYSFSSTLSSGVSSACGGRW